MFFDSYIVQKISSVLSLSWNADRGISGERPFNALSYRIEGDADFLINGEKKSVSSGDIVFVPQNVKYTLKHGKENLIVFHFDSDIELGKEIETFSPYESSLFHKLFYDAYSAWTNKKTGYEYFTASCFNKIMYEIQKQHIEQNSHYSDRRMKQTVEHIHSDFTNSELSVEKLAFEFGTSDTYFRRVFKKETGTTPLKYINSLRINHSKELLQSGYFTVNRVAEICGFNDPKYFCNVFKQSEGVPPSSYMNMNK